MKVLITSHVKVFLSNKYDSYGSRTIAPREGGGAIFLRAIARIMVQWTLSISNSQGTNKFVRDRESSR